MADTLTLTVDGREVAVSPGATVLDACDQAGVYVPRLCAYPGLQPLGDCGLCFVSIDGVARRACSVPVVDAMVVATADPEALGYRTSSMRAILADHPHVCLTCPDRDGCSRTECVYGNPPETRCCDEFGRCEIAEVAAHVGALEAAPRYEHRWLGAAVDHNILQQVDLCVGCGRCVAACDSLEEAGRALTLVETRTLVGSGLPGGTGAVPEAGPEAWESRSYLGRHVAVPKEDDLRESGCTFCGACVMVCPSGALTSVGAKGAAWLGARREKTTLRVAVRAPQDVLPFTEASVRAAVPARAGVFYLILAGGDVLQISGVADLRAGLFAAAATAIGAEAAAFRFQEDPLYTQRESELLARHLHKHGRLPRGNDVFADLGDDDE